MSEHFVGTIVLSPGQRSVALVKYAGSEGWQFPSMRAPPGEAPEAVGVEVAAQQLGLPVQSTLCAEPILHALGPGPGQSTRFLLAFNVTEGVLEPSPAASPSPLEASWQDLASLIEETEGQAVQGNQLVAVLKQLQQFFRRIPGAAAYLGGGPEEALAAGMLWREQRGGWQGQAPRDYLYSWCKQQGLPTPAYNVFEQGKSAAKIHFCVTCLLPHAGLQLTPDAVFQTPMEAINNAAILAALYLEGAIRLDNPLVHIAPAGVMAKVPHGHKTIAEVEEEGWGPEQERPRREREREPPLPRAQPVQQQQPQQQQPRQQRPGAGGGGGGPPGEKAARAAPFPPGGARERPAKKQKPLFTLPQALAAIPPGKNPVQAVKEVCDRLRWQLPSYQEAQRGQGLIQVTAGLPEAGLAGVEGPPHADRRQAKMLAAETLLGHLRNQVAGAGGS